MMSLPRRLAGFTLAETIVAVTLVVLVGTMVGVSVSFMGFSLLEGRLQSNVRNDTVRALQTIMRDGYAATNISPSCGSLVSNNHTVILRAPQRLQTGENVPGRFEFIVYRVIPEGQVAGMAAGLVREVYRAPENVQQADPEAIPSNNHLVDRKLITPGVIYMRVDYGGVPIQEVVNLTVVGDLGVYLSSKAQAMNQEAYTAETYIEVAMRNRKSLGWRKRTPPEI